MVRPAFGWRAASKAQRMLQGQWDIGRLGNRIGPNQDLLNFVAIRGLRQCIFRAPVLCPETAAQLAMRAKRRMRVVCSGMCAKAKVGSRSA